MVYCIYKYIYTYIHIFTHTVVSPTAGAHAAVLPKAFCTFAFTMPHSWQVHSIPAATHLASTIINPGLSVQFL